jgi:energy-coupling factor transporter ATP-binding protein EcfA2
MAAAELLPIFTLWQGTTNPRGQRVMASWEDWFARPEFTNPPRNVTNKATLRAWSPAFFDGDRRNKAHVQGVTAICLDYEAHGDHPGTSIEEALGLWKGYFGLLHTTYSHRPGSPRFRVILPLNRPITAEEQEYGWASVARRCEEAGHSIDVKTSDASRLWFFPGTPPGGEYIRIALDGELLDADEICRAIEEPIVAPPPPAPASSPQLRSRGSNVERYVQRALEKACDTLARSPAGDRNNDLARESYALGGLLHLGVLGEREVIDAFLGVARAQRWTDEPRTRGTIQRQLRAGASRPRSVPDLRIVESAGSRDVWSLPPQPHGAQAPEAAAGGGGSGDGGGARRAAATPAPKPPREDKGVALVKMLDELVFFRSPTGRLFMAFEGEALACESTRYTEVIAGLFWGRFQVVLNKSSIEDATRIRASRNLEVRPAAVRLQGSADRLLLDLGQGGTWQVTAEGDQVGPVDDPIPWFRPSGSSSMPAPQIAASDEESAQVLAELRELLDIADDGSWAAILAWLFACLRPVGPYPLLILRGEKGSGKSTLARALRRLVDPRKPELKTLPPKGNEALRTLAISAEHAHVLVFDNLSSLDGDLSDALCRLSTGDGFEVRKMYAGRDLDVFESCRPMLLTSITDAATRADLLDRSLLVRLPARQRRMDDDQLEAALAALAPRVLGALLWAAHRAMVAGPTTDVPGSIRMRAPARWAAAAESALGLPPGAVVAAYLTSREESEAFEAEDPFLTALFGYLEDKGGEGFAWKTTAEQLLKTLTGHAYPSDQRERPPSGWPQSGRGARARLDRSAAALRAGGVVVSYTQEGHAKTRTITLTRQSSATAGTDRPQENAGNQAKPDGADDADG